MMNVRFTKGSLALALLIGISGVANLHGQSFQFRLSIEDRSRQYGPSLDARAHGYEHAYRDGADRGRLDREQGLRYNLRTNDYRDSAPGFEMFMGDRGQFQQGYREGYKTGYDDGYKGRTGRYGQIYGRTEAERNQWQHPVDVYAPRQWGADDMAFDVGYRDGVTFGQYDRGRNVRGDFENTDAYRNANHGHGSNYGNSEAYNAQYRSGFQRGYQDGYGRSR